MVMEREVVRVGVEAAVAVAARSQAQALEGRVVAESREAWEVAVPRVELRVVAAAGGLTAEALMVWAG